ncbi:hypothetical protein CDD83_6682 [Cordyceps sp. RAO-2017]|nr:hypothetical protein CDD83_6682 [Cordyceps sp. RAO-2017]
MPPPRLEARFPGTMSELMSLEALYGIAWGGFALCVLAFAGRLWIRWVAVRKLVAEDGLMLAALGLQLATATICQLWMRFVYAMDEIGSGRRAPPPTFVQDMTAGSRALLASELLTAAGLWAVKLNFLLFFHRIFYSTRRLYRALWWAVLVVTLLSLAVFLGAAPYMYKCTLGDADFILRHCATPPAVRLASVQLRITSTVDAFNDVLIMVFPIAILWQARVTVKKKMYLSLMFLLMLFTATVAVVRGTFTYTAVSDSTQHPNVAWMWFGLQVELIVSCLVASLVSFRALFTQNKKPGGGPRVLVDDQPPTVGGTGEKRKRRVRQWYESVAETCHELEGITAPADAAVPMSGSSREGLVTDHRWTDGTGGGGEPVRGPDRVHVRL